jgi:hypothetical protein
MKGFSNKQTNQKKRFTCSSLEIDLVAEGREGFGDHFHEVEGGALIAIPSVKLIHESIE